MKMESMSKNIVAVMNELAKNIALVELLINNNNHLPSLRNAEELKEKITDDVRRNLIIPNASESKIFPYPFDPDATTTDGSFIRVYYNNGDFNENETIAESQIHIDIIVSKSLWLINDGVNSMIRPYEMMGRIADMVGRRSNNATIRLDIKSYQHLYVNTKFDSIRLYCEYMSVESRQANDDFKVK